MSTELPRMESSVAAFPGYTAMYGPTSQWVKPPSSPYFWARYDGAPYMEPTKFYAGLADTLDEAREKAGFSS